MEITKKLLIFVIIALLLIALIFIYNYFSKSLFVRTPEKNFNQESLLNNKNIPTNDSYTRNDFMGPAVPPSIKGPSGLPPGQ